MANTNKLFLRRRSRTRRNVRRHAVLRPRLSVFRSNKHIYAQVIDDDTGVTKASACSLEKDIRSRLPSGANVEAAVLIGKMIAERALAAGVKDVVFDRGGYRYHGRVKALAEGAREGGLSF